MDPLTQLSEHLKFLGELGVPGVAREASWRRRETATQSGASAESLATSGPEAAEPVVPSTREARTLNPISSHAPESAPLEVASDPAAALVLIRQDLGDCTRCKLHGLGRKQIVFGVGNPSADLMFAGEAPGRDEDIQGEPFVGRAGQLLTKMIEAMGHTRESVYIANVIKCRPPENRNPEPDEVAACEPFLFRQVELIKPKVIVALGKFAAQTLLKTTDPISKLRGRAYKYGGAHLVPTFHPAYLLRNPPAKKDAWEDLKRAMTLLEQE